MLSKIIKFQIASQVGKLARKMLLGSDSSDNSTGESPVIGASNSVVEGPGGTAPSPTKIMIDMEQPHPQGSEGEENLLLASEKLSRAADKMGSKSVANHSTTVNNIASPSKSESRSVSVKADLDKSAAYQESKKASTELVKSDKDKVGILRKMTGSVTKFVTGTNREIERDRQKIIQVVTRLGATSSLIGENLDSLQEAAKTNDSIRELLDNRKELDQIQGRIQESILNKQEINTKDASEFLRIVDLTSQAISQMPGKMGKSVSGALGEYKEVIMDTRRDEKMRRDYVKELQSIVRHSGVDTEESRELLKINSEQLDFTKKESKNLDFLISKIALDTVDSKIYMESKEMNKNFERMNLTQEETRRLLDTASKGGYTEGKSLRERFQNAPDLISGVETLKGGAISVTLDAMGLSGLHGFGITEKLTELMSVEGMKDAFRTAKDAKDWTKDAAKTTVQTVKGAASWTADRARGAGGVLKKVVSPEAMAKASGGIRSVADKSLGIANAAADSIVTFSDEIGKRTTAIAEKARPATQRLRQQLVSTIKLRRMDPEHKRKLVHDEEMIESSREIEDAIVDLKYSQRASNRSQKARDQYTRNDLRDIYFEARSTDDRLEHLEREAELQTSALNNLDEVQEEMAESGMGKGGGKEGGGSFIGDFLGNYLGLKGFKGLKGGLGKVLSKGKNILFGAAGLAKAGIGKMGVGRIGAWGSVIALYGLIAKNMMEAQDELGDVLGKLSTFDKFGWGAGKAIKTLTGGLIDLPKWSGFEDTIQLKRDMMQHELTHDEQYAEEIRKKKMSKAARELLQPDDPVGIRKRYIYLAKTGQIVKDNTGTWVLPTELTAETKVKGENVNLAGEGTYTPQPGITQDEIDHRFARTITEDLFSRKAIELINPEDSEGVRGRYNELVKTRQIVKRGNKWIVPGDVETSPNSVVIHEDQGPGYVPPQPGTPEWDTARQESQSASLGEITRESESQPMPTVIPRTKPEYVELDSPPIKRVPLYTEPERNRNSIPPSSATQRGTVTQHAHELGRKTVIDDYGIAFVNSVLFE